ncbi:6071_t:CDS:2 [Entrophospora sp. SA101]|nr:6071_t:CDS:2 [Entrophospora sp. SA101]
MADNPDNLEIKDNDSSGSGKKKDQYYITISNDGEYIARLDCSKDESLRLKITHHKNFELLNNDSDIEKGQDNVKICNIVKKLTFLDELNPYVKPSEVKDPQKEETKRGNKKQEEQIKEDNRKLLIWSFSISNRFFFNNKPTILVAISRVVPNDMINCDRPINHLIDKLKEYNELKLKYQNMKELHYYPLHSHPSINETCLTSNIGGIVRFLPEVEKNKTSFLITNVKGFYKSLDNLDKPNIHSSLNLKKFLFPPKLKRDIEVRIQTMELYSMLTMEAEQSFFTREELKTRKYGIPTYAISLNNLLLAFTRGNNDIRIYSMESEVEKQNIITTYNESSGSGKKKDQYYIAISNDGEYIARLDCNKDENELNPYVKPSEAKYPQEDNRKQEQTKKDNSNQEEQIKKDNRKLLIWSFSISNTISFNSKPTILVAISRVVPNDMIDRDRPINHLLDKLEEYEELKLKYQNMKELYPLHTQPSSTVIFYIDISNIYKDDDKSNNNNYEIKIDENGICLTSNIGGIVRFLPEVEKNKTSLLITNVKGFYKSLDNLDKPNIYSILNLKRFLFPPKFKKDIETQFEQTPCLEKLLSYIYKNYFLFNQFKNRIQALELYSMLTMEAEQCFFTREELKTQKYGIPTYAISLNNLLLAFTSGNKDIRIYSMESGLFIALKNLDDKDEFLFLEFIHNDERLFIVTRNDTNHKISIKIWDIFNSSPEDFKYEINNNIIPKKFDCLNIARSNGMIFFVKEDGKVLNGFPAFAGALKTLSDDASQIKYTLGIELNLIAVLHRPLLKYHLFIVDNKE